LGLFVLILIHVVNENDYQYHYVAVIQLKSV